jgi:hypothetical protein
MSLDILDQRPGKQFDETLDPDKTAWVFFTVSSIISYNGIPVGGGNQLEIPAGETEFVVDIYYYSGVFRITGKNLKFNYNFKPGKKYFMDFSSIKQGGRIVVLDNPFGYRVFEYDQSEMIAGRISNDVFSKDRLQRPFIVLGDFTSE